VADWTELIDRAQLRGPLGQLAQNATLIAVDGGVVRLAMNESHEHLAVGPMVAQLEQRLGATLGRDVKVRFERAGGNVQTPAEQRARADSARRSAAEEAVQADPFVQSMIDTFGARVVPGSVRPLDG
jgi:DNA polymerase-3 subunit gamma/tau